MEITKKQKLIDFLDTAIDRLKGDKEMGGNDLMLLRNMRASVKSDMFVTARAAMDDLSDYAINTEVMKWVVEGVQRAAEAKEEFDSWRR